MRDDGRRARRKAKAESALRAARQHVADRGDLPPAAFAAQHHRREHVLIRAVGTADAVVTAVGDRDVGGEETQRVDGDRALAARALLRRERAADDGLAAATRIAGRLLL